MTTNINPLKKNYIKRSLYSIIDNTDSGYRSGETTKKSLDEIQTDEIKRIMRDDPKQYEFLQVFANPLISGTGINKKGQIKSFDLRNKVKFKIQDEKILIRIITSMIELFKKDVKKLRKISNEDIDDILSLKKELFSQVTEAQISQQPNKSLFNKFKAFVARKFKPKPKQPQLTQYQIEQSIDDEARMLTNIFFEIIDTVQKLGKDQSKENVAVVINKFFTITMDQLFSHFPEFNRAGPLQNLIFKQGQKGQVKMGYRFNLLSLAVFLGIEPLVVLFLFLGGDPSLTNQDNQDASYHLLFFQMSFRNIAMNVRWKPSDKDESKAEYKAYDQQFESRTAYFEKLIRNIQSTEKSIPLSQENRKVLGEFMSYFRNKAQPQPKPFQTNNQQQQPEQNPIEKIKKEIKELKEMIQKQSQQREKNQFDKFKQQQQQLQQQLPQQLLQKQQQQLPQQPQNYYNFDKYLFNNNKLRRMLTFLSIFGQGIDLSRLVPQAEPAQLYVVGNVQSYPKMSKSSVLINMAKDKYLNEKVIIEEIDSKYVKYSVYDLLRYFLIFNGYDSSNLNKFKNTGYRNNSPNIEIEGFNKELIRLSKIQQKSLSNDLVLTPLPFNFISNINQTSDPFDYSFFFYLIANKAISSNHKLELGCIALLQGSDPNIMPNITQNLLSQLDPKLKLCDIFKVFLAGDYERIIRIFKMYSDDFKKGIWEDKLGDFIKTLRNQQEIIRYLERQKLSSELSRDLRRQYNSYQYPENRSVFSQSSALPQQEKGFFGRLGDKVSSVWRNPFRKQPEVLPQEPIIMTQPYGPQADPSFPSINLSQRFPERTALLGGMSGGSKIKLRTFHFLEPKSYNEHAFRAEKPIIAGKMAYDFLRTHYKLKKGSSIMFTIEDRQKDRKYNYIGEKVNNKIIIKST